MEDYEETSPFWPKPTVAPRRRSCLSRLLSLPVVPVIAVVALFFFVPPFLSLAGNLKLKPSWDSFSVLLVLFAVLSGVFAKRNDAVLDDPETETEPAAPVTRPWLDEGVSRRTTGRSGSLRRSGGSHKDLRRESPPVCEDRFRWFDDFEINRRSSPDRRFGIGTGTGENFDDVKVIPVDTCVLRSSPETPISSPPEKSISPPETPISPKRAHDLEKKVIAIEDKAEIEKSSSPSPKRAHRLDKKEIVSKNEAEIEKTISPSPKRAHRLEKKEIASKNEAEIEKTISPSPPDLQDSKRALESAENLKNPADSEQKQGKFERRKNMAIKEITMVLQLASIYNHNQIKRITRKSKPKATNNSGSDSDSNSNSNSPLKATTVTNRSATMLPPPSPAPPPPPLPPPPSIFHNLVKKGLTKNKNNWKKIKSLASTAQISPPREQQQQQPPHLFTTMPPPSPAPPPPPMPPPPSIFHNLVKKGLNKKNWKKIKSLSLTTPTPISTTETQISSPPKPPRRRSCSGAGKPPLAPVPAKIDCVRVKSARSTVQCEAVDRSLIRDGSGGSDGGEGVGPVWCASPDVNVKADSFIARLKDGWRLEKMNSVREKKDVGLDPLAGPL